MEAITALIKEFGNLTLGAGAIVALVIVIIKLLDVLKAVNDNIKENTAVSRALVEKVEKSLQVDQQVVETIRRCPNVKTYESI